MHFGSDLHQAAVKREWKDFIINEKTPQYVRPEIINAWVRCQATGVMPFTNRAPKIQNQNELNARLYQNKTLITVGESAINYLSQFIADSKFTVAISDAEGFLLLVLGSHDAVSSATQGNGVVGANWSESSIGNNPIGTAIAEDKAVHVFGCEHFCICAHNWTGSGAPIHDSEGTVIGAISICGERTNPHSPSFGMTVMTAYAIEQQFTILNAMEIADTEYGQKNVIIDSISEGLLVVDKSGTISLTNKRFLKMFHFTTEQLLRKNISIFFSDGLLLNAIKDSGELVDHVTQLQTGLATHSCIVTYSPFTPDHSSGGVLIINDMSRYKKLAKEISKNEAGFTFRNIVGQNEAFLSTLKLAESCADTNSTVLLLGESGTGKDVFAQAIHNSSPRRFENFVTINCSAIPKNLISSELFGYVEGSFTGAKKSGSMGKFELADKGTLFLDEIGEMPMSMQSVLLRALEQRVIYRVGGQEPIPLDVRIIAATNTDLTKAIQEGRFRQDLYYRLNVLSIRLIPLRERSSDISLLIQYFLNKLNAKYKKNVLSFSSEAMTYLEEYAWPGNIRELQNVIERGVALCNSEQIGAKLLPYDLAGASTNTLFQVEDPVSLPVAGTGRYKNNLEEKEYLVNLLDANRWNVSKAAQQMNISRSTMYRKLKQHALVK